MPTVSSASAREVLALTMTDAPPAASERAIARPMLRAPPVTSATLPASSSPGFIPMLLAKRSSPRDETGYYCRERVKRIAIVQSNYIPWKGYFDLINAVDEFILYDDMQFTRRDWRNRNRDQDAARAWNGSPSPWPSRGATCRRSAIRISAIRAGARRTGPRSYTTTARRPTSTNTGRSSSRCMPTGAETRLSNMNYRFISAICGILGIATAHLWSMDYGPLAQTARRSGLPSSAGAPEARIYLSGPAARDYIEPQVVRDRRHLARVLRLCGLPGVCAALRRLRARRHGARPAVQCRAASAALHEDLRLSALERDRPLLQRETRGARRLAARGGLEQQRVAAAALRRNCFASARPTHASA